MDIYKTAFRYPLILLAIFSTFLCGYAFADSTVIAPQDYLAQVLDAIHAMGGLSWTGKVASVILLIVASMKVSILHDWVWSKLGAAQAWVGPILGLLAGILMPALSGQPITLPTVMAYVAAGSGSLILHELLDTVKSIPGLGAVYVGIINLVESALAAVSLGKSSAS